MRSTLLLAVFLFIAIAISAQVRNPQNAGAPVLPQKEEQNLFFGNQELDDPVPLPADIFQLLLARREVKDALRGTDASAANDPAKLFQAAEVHLSGPDRADLLVMSLFRATGAKNTWFWIVRTTPRPTVLLFLDADSVEVKDRKTNGYRDIDAEVLSPSRTSLRLYKFDGRTYKLTRETWHKNPR